MDVTSTLDPRRPVADVDIRAVEQEPDAPAAITSSRPHRLYERLEDWLAGYPESIPVRVVHRLPMILWRLGLGRVAGDLLLLTTTGRTSGLPRRIAIGPNRIDGHLFLWNPYGERAHWYRNLVADPIVTVQGARGTWTALAVHPTDHDEAIALYEDNSRIVGRRFREYLADQGVTDSADDFARHIARLHVIRLDPVDQPGPPPLRADLAWVWPVAAALLLMWWVVRR